MINVLYLFLIIFAIIAIQTTRLRNAVVYLGIYSLLCSFCYLLLMAPDVAIAEAVIGCTLSTVLYLVAIKRYKILRIYFCDASNKHSGKEKYSLINILSEFSAIHETQLDIVDSHKSAKFIKKTLMYDIIVEETMHGTITIYSDLSNYVIDLLVRYIKSNNMHHVHFVHISSNNEGETI